MSLSRSSEGSKSVLVLSLALSLAVIVVGAAGILAWQSGRQVTDISERLVTANRDVQNLKTELAGRSRYEKSTIGTLPSLSSGDSIAIANKTCQPLAQIGVYVDEATIVPSVLEALRKRDPKIAATDLEAMTNAVIYSDAAGFKDSKDYVPGVFIRLADGGVARLSPSVVPMAGFYRIALKQEYLDRNSDKICPTNVARPELSDCLPSAVSMVNHEIYMGSYESNCSEIIGMN